MLNLTEWSKSSSRVSGRALCSVDDSMDSQAALWGVRLQAEKMSAFENLEKWDGEGVGRELAKPKKNRIFMLKSKDGKAVNILFPMGCAWEENIGIVYVIMVVYVFVLERERQGVVSMKHKLASIYNSVFFIIWHFHIYDANIVISSFVWIIFLSSFSSFG